MVDVSPNSEAVAGIPKTYAPSEVEGRLYAMWESKGYFRPEAGGTLDPFVIAIPPPNVTGELHLGHALTYTIEDVLGRFKRMQGHPTLILPGSDHASIAVHAKVEAMLAQEGIRRRFDLGRERFLERAWEWKAKYSDTIRDQFKAMGEGYDWSRERFTLDPAYYRAVMTMFVQLFNEGYIYRGSRVINWCAGCQTGISDIEVRQEERDDELYYVRLPFEEGPDGSESAVTVATVRPETMFGDVAVAVHPEDERYRGMVGKHIRHPLTGQVIPIIGDSFVDPSFGSGAVKITPAHDYADFEVGERHDLPMPIVITPHGRMAEDVPEPYRNLTIQEARKVAVEALSRGGFLVRSEPLSHSVPTCDRCGTVIEPLLSEQWFMHMHELAQPAIEAVRSGRVRFVPERWTHVYLDWMENIRPWNISRQLWWGQRIPIYHCVNGHVTAAVDSPASCPECDSQEIVQDPDVLDTWFSSALWPFATLGWPDRTPDLDSYYPTSFMNTSSQILYLWIARMIMMGIHFMGEIPFPVVLINPTILNERGQRMSKSLGTGIDPVETVERYGADATRFGVLSAGSIMQQEIRFSGNERAEEGRKFANKVWNAGRLVLQTLEVAGNEQEEEPRLAPSDQWILSRLSAARNAVTASLETYELSSGLRDFYAFFWSEFADWYLEIAKLRLRVDDPRDRAAVRAVLWTVLEGSMRLLHPYMPFITEEIWGHLARSRPAGADSLSDLPNPPSESIMTAPWPAATSRNLGAEQEMAVVMQVVSALRNLRSEHSVPPKARLDAVVVAPGVADTMAGMSSVIEGLASLERLEVTGSAPANQAEMAEVVVDGATMWVPLNQLSDLDEEISRLRRELASAQMEQERLQALLGNPNFVARAPEVVVSRERERLEKTSALVSSMQDHLRLLGAES